MHEVGIAQEILRLIEENAAPQGPGKVLSARIRVGALAGVEAESLRFALEVCGRGARAEGMAVQIIPVRAEVICKACGGRGPFEPGMTACANCGSADLRLEGGRDLQLESFEME